MIALNPDAVAIAGERDAERAAGKPSRSAPWHPGDGEGQSRYWRPNGTSAGSLALAGHRAARDSHVVHRLRAAGAVILGKTNLSEWANFRSTRSTSGWSSRGGQTRNPYDTARTPGGSSSGSAVAVAAGFCAGAIGTETDGSIVHPCSMNGLVGIKPTVGLVSRSGIVPIAASQDSAGPMTRTVADAALLLSAIAGTDPDDPATEAADRQRRDYRAALDPAGLHGARLGVARAYCGYHERADRLLEEAIGELKKAGALVIDPIELPPLDEIRPFERLSCRPSSSTVSTPISGRPTPGSATSATSSPSIAHMPRRSCRTSARRSSKPHSSAAASTSRPTSKRSPPLAGTRAAMASMPRWRATVWTRSSRRPPRPPG